MSLTKIQSIDPGSPAHRAGLRPGETVTQVNGHAIVDVLDYKFYTYDPSLELVLRAADGTERTVSLEKNVGEDLGLNFETYLMDKARSCANNCIFCFVDQMPPNMRETLYFKDDDARLSFLMGNYITLTNLSEREIQRIIEADLPVGTQHLVHRIGPQLPAVHRISAEVGGNGVAHHVHLHAELEQQSAQPIFVVCQCTPQGVHQGAGEVLRGILRGQVAHVEPQGLFNKFTARFAVVLLQPAVHPADHTGCQPDGGALFVFLCHYHHLPFQKYLESSPLVG